MADNYLCYLMGDTFRILNIEYNPIIFVEAYDTLVKDEHLSFHDLAENVNKLNLKTILLALIDHSMSDVDIKRIMAKVFRQIHTCVYQKVGQQMNIGQISIQNLQAEMFFVRCIVFILEDKPTTRKDSSSSGKCIGAVATIVSVLCSVYCIFRR